MLTLIIVSFNSFRTIQECLKEILSSDKYEVIIVDNASTDDTLDQLKIQFPKVKVLGLTQNIGYGRAANRALNLVETDYALLLNPDMKADIDSIVALESRMSMLGGNVALLAPAVTNKDYQKCGLLAKDWVIGAAMFFNMSAMRKVGLFDENIFLFSEESDLCYRMKAAGMDIYLDSDIYIEHLYKQSSTPSLAVDYLKDWHFGWSRMYFLDKHDMAVGKRGPWKTLLKYGIKMLVSTNSIKRMSYRAKFLGTLAFVRGEKAFLEDGNAQNSYRLLSS